MRAPVPAAAVVGMVGVIATDRAGNRVSFVLPAAERLDIASALVVVTGLEEGAIEYRTTAADSGVLRQD